MGLVGTDFQLFGAHGVVSGTVGPCGVVVILPDSLVQPVRHKDSGRRSSVLILGLSIQ